MSEKEKPKRGSKMSLLRSCLIFALYPALIFTVIGCGLVYWAIGGYVKPSLDAQYIPTAEYLLENPIQDYTFQSLNDYFPFYANLDVNNSENQICISVRSMYESDFDNLAWSEVYVNEQIVSRFNPAEGVLLSMPAVSGFCFSGHLDSGIHIIEFRAKENLFAEPYYVQRWAVEIP